MELNLHQTAKKLFKSGYFKSFELKKNVLHCSYNEWQFNFYRHGRMTVSLPETFVDLRPSFESDYQDYTFQAVVYFTYHRSYPTDNPDFCLRVALDYIF